MNRDTQPLRPFDGRPGPAAHRALPAVTDLVESPDYAFAFRERAPVPEHPGRLLIALHGADGDELQFADAFPGARADDAIVLPRGPRTLPGGRIGWFREAVADGDARAEPAEFDESLQRLVDFVGQQQRRHGIDPARTVLVGFSQGGALALSAAVTTPACIGAVAVIGGRLPRRVEPQVELPPTLADVDVLLLHAEDDEVLPPVHAEEAAAFLTAMQLTPTVRLAGRGHRLSGAAVAELGRWLERIAPRRAS